MCRTKDKTFPLRAAKNIKGEMMFIVNTEDGTLRQKVDLRKCGRGVANDSCANGKIGKILPTC